MPDFIFLPLGNGSLFLGVYFGLQDLKRSGLISEFPKIVLVQAENCSPIYLAFERKENLIPDFEFKTTIAEGIAIRNPRRGKEILKIVYENKFLVMAVKEEEILDAQKELANFGLFVEPTSSVSYAGYKKFKINNKKVIKPLIVLTGSGLKSI